MKRVLIVDDEHEVAEALGDLLSETYAVTVVHDGEQCLRAVDRGGIDAVVLDVMMPKMSGEQVVAELRSRGSGIPVIFASAAYDVAEKARRSQVQDFVAKPFCISDLELKLKRILGTSGTGGTSSSGDAGSSEPAALPPSGKVHVSRQNVFSGEGPAWSFAGKFRPLHARDAVSESKQRGWRDVR